MDLLESEHKREPLAPRARLFWRLGRNAMFAFGVIVIALAVGMSGYMGFERMGFVDGFLNAAMILSGMGPVNELHTVAGKVFAGLYAIASGLLLFAVAGILLAPVYQRMIHRFHLEEGGGVSASKGKDRRQSS